PVRRGANEDVDFAAWMKPDDGALPQSALKAHRPRHLRRPETTDFNVGGDADTKVASLLAQPGLLGSEIAVANLIQRLVQCSLIIAAVVRQTCNHRTAVVEGR